MPKIAENAENYRNTETLPNGINPILQRFGISAIFSIFGNFRHGLQATIIFNLIFYKNIFFNKFFIFNYY